MKTCKLLIWNYLSGLVEFWKYFFHCTIAQICNDISVILLEYEKKFSSYFLCTICLLLIIYFDSLIFYCIIVVKKNHQHILQFMNVTQLLSISTFWRNQNEKSMGKHIFEIWRYRSNFRKTLSYCAIRRVVLGLRSKSSLRSLRKCIQNLDFFQAQKFHRVRLSPHTVRTHV